MSDTSLQARRDWYLSLCDTDEDRAHVSRITERTVFYYPEFTHDYVIENVFGELPNFVKFSPYVGTIIVRWDPDIPPVFEEVHL